jgi:hypothetical protein
METDREDRYRCPQCGGRLVWTLRGLSDSARSILRCEKNPSSTRLDWVLSTEKFCMWEGIVKRRNGKIIFLFKDGVSELRKKI